MLTHTWLTRCASASRVLFPDAQIEYVTAVGGGRRCNVEVASEHYGGGDIRAKAAAGFQMYAASGRAASFVRRVLVGAGSGGNRGRRGGGRGGSREYGGVRDMRPWRVVVGVNC